MKEILIIDNQHRRKEIVAQELQNEGYNVKAMEDEAFDLNHLDASCFDLAIINIYPDIPATWGIYLELKHYFPDLPALIYMNHQALEDLKSAIKKIFNHKEFALSQHTAKRLGGKR